MSTPTKRFMNWSNVVFTPTNGTPVVFTGVTSVQIDTGGSLAKFAGDGDRFNTVIVNDFNEPVIAIHSADLAAVRAFPVGTTGTLVATYNDARNGTGAGSLTFTMTNAVITTNPIKGSHRQFGQGVITFTAFSTDGQTNPLSMSIAN